MNYVDIYKRTENYVIDLFKDHTEAEMPYHNIKHTKYVVSKATEIAAHYQLSEEEIMIVYVAAWFHDTGYLLVPPKVHENKSEDLMREFIKEFPLLQETIDQIAGCIQSTCYTTEPQSLLQQIVSDADTFNLGTKNFKETNKLVFEEFGKNRPDFSKKEFNIDTLKMFEDHTYYTSYCQDLLTKRKKQNMKKLKKKIAKKENDELETPEEKLVIDEKQGTTKGMQTMLRLTSSNHIKLSEMADSKANILISVNAIIISVILSVLFRKLQSDPYLTIPTMIFLTSAVATIIIAILATRPKVNTGVFDEEQVKNKSINLLFFGNFHRMSFPDYENAMKIMMQDADYLYASMLQDIYNLGKVLGKKYQLIRLAYTIFMIGIIVSVLAFAVASIMTGSAPVVVNAGSNGSPF